ncbi:uncharacterized protein PHALS_14639 [Plasmopara halstedii]|uniref:Uncharacterized protein n=1 Tax=Plasmopara halstedii TaxID=4781 RepID=A0A0P1AMG1_PLAHL|nr:uncharacterized protein PHALS_14639 [Plasmopara halstedii]CEG42561.1 hypothetical protein PHALS_14639 [Plasmopara halstedii]|eukprot:XP_024578930.1 hypothetical protein PHALS_14639 [Plasmopara halstedii]
MCTLFSIVKLLRGDLFSTFALVVSHLRRQNLVVIFFQRLADKSGVIVRLLYTGTRINLSELQSLSDMSQNRSYFGSSETSAKTNAFILPSPGEESGAERIMVYTLTTK